MAIYDPLVDKQIPSSKALPESFWASSIEPNNQPDFQALEKDVEVDVVIIGGGYTGLSCAFHLQQHNIEAIQKNQKPVSFALIDANQPGFGCSGRNGGFVLPGSGRLGIQGLVKRFGQKRAIEIFSQYIESTKLVQSFIDLGIDCEQTPGGYLKLATSKEALANMQREAEYQQEYFGGQFRLLSPQQIDDSFIKCMPITAGIFAPDVFSINPLKLTHGIAKHLKNQQDNASSALYGNTPMLNASKHLYRWLINTPKAKISAEKVVVATNAYMSSNCQFEILKDRTFPVLSSVLVTKPLTQAQLTQIGMRSGLMAMDTRAMKYYYRLLPDNRLLFGGRGAITGKKADNAKYKQNLLEGLKSTFVHLKNVEINSFWSGWVSVSIDDFPRVFYDKQQQISYASGYCGSGLAFSLLSGKQLARSILSEEPVLSTAFLDSPLAKIPFSSFKRTGLAMYYKWQEFQSLINRSK